jgi:collagen type I/II/III/V/XI/XXIV/XXVII alpha
MTAIAIGFGQTSTLDPVGSATASSNASTGVLAITGGGTYPDQRTGDHTGDTFLVSKDLNSDGPIALAACFCNGTRILTDRGKIPVQRLAVGDRVVTADGTSRPVRRIGHHRLDLAHHPEPERVRPILICAGAIARQVPHRDLYVSPDQTLLLDDVLVPARLLINGASIRGEAARKAVTYYHVELDTHDIRSAGNLATESALGTGDDALFEHRSAALILHPDLTNDQDRPTLRSGRRFVDAPDLVEPIWRRLAQRSPLLGLDLPADVETTNDPGLHVVCAKRTIKPISRQDGHYIFVLPRTEGPIHLVSHTARPCDLKPWVEDRRRLGVLVSKLTLKHGDEVDLIPLDDPQMADGWWAIERDRSMLRRWTNGDAVIPSPVNGPAVLEITIDSVPDYLVGQPAGTAAAHASAMTKAA